ncbi:MAG: DegQ family serine endoprotease [Vicinamibacterales bacterium]
MTFRPLLRKWRVTVPALVLAGGLAAFGVNQFEPHLSATAAGSAVTATPAAPATTPLATASYADAVARALPAVVTVEIEKRATPQPALNLPDDPFFRRFFGAPDLQQGPAPIQEGLGSGVIMTADGTILTNNHVVDGAEHVTVTLSDGRAFPGKVVGTDPATDLAVLKIDATGLPAIAVADSDRLRVGDVVLAVGNPLGIGQTVTMGIVSAKGRTTGLGSDQVYEDFLQTDAPINRGNSGGALITTSGELVGINSQIMSPSGGNIGIGFAIPSNMAQNVMTQLVSTGHVRRGMLGVEVQPVTSDLARSLGLDAVEGAIVASVTPESPADEAGLVQGDVVLKVDGTAVRSSNDLRNRISSRAPGTTVVLDVLRNGDHRQVSVKLGEMPTDAAEAAGPAESNALGMTLESLTPQQAQALRLPRNTTGVVVASIDPAGRAARAGLAEGDLIRKIDGRDVTTPEQARAALSTQRDRPALVVAERAGRTFFIALPTN